MCTCITLNDLKRYKEYEQKLSKRKVSRFTGFHASIEKTLASSVWRVLKEAIAELNNHWENFCSSLKIHENCETFLSLIYVNQF